MKIKNLGDLKDYLDTLTEDQLNQPMNATVEDDGAAVKITEAWETEEDIYYNIDDNEDGGTIEELKELHGDDFKIDNYKLSTKKGTIFFS